MSVHTSMFNCVMMKISEWIESLYVLWVTWVSELQLSLSLALNCISQFLEETVIVPTHLRPLKSGSGP